MATPTARIPIRAVPQARKAELVGWTGEGRLKVKVRAPAEDGRANAELLAVLAQALGLPVRALRLVAGEKSRSKTLEVHGCEEAAIRARLTAACSDKKNPD